MVQDDHILCSWHGREVMDMPTNLTQPIYNKEQIPAGETIIFLPNDFAQYDELWAHVRIQGTNGSPTSGSLRAIWQTEHPQDSGDYTDLNPTYLDLDTSRNAHILHGGIDFPKYLTNKVLSTFSPPIEYIRGVKIYTPRIRLKLIADFQGGTNPAYIVSIAYHLRKTSAESRITKVKTKNGHQAVSITDTGNHDVVVDVSDLTKKNIIIAHTLDQPVDVKLYTESDNYSYVYMGVLEGLESTQVITSKDMNGLDGPLQKIRISVSAKTAPTTGEVSTWVEGL